MSFVTMSVYQFLMLNYNRDGEFYNGKKIRDFGPKSIKADDFANLVLFDHEKYYVLFLRAVALVLRVKIVLCQTDDKYTLIH